MITTRSLNAILAGILASLLLNQTVSYLISSTTSAEAWAEFVFGVPLWVATTTTLSITVCLFLLPGFVTAAVSVQRKTRNAMLLGVALGVFYFATGVYSGKHSNSPHSFFSAILLFAGYASLILGTFLGAQLQQKIRIKPV